MSARLLAYARLSAVGMLRVLDGDPVHTPWHSLDGAVPGPTGIPPLKARWFFGQPFPKFGRMDALCKLGVAASQLIAPALSALPGDEVAQVGGTMLGSIEVDLQYEHTRLAGHPSPALFVYTLPSMFQGEVAILHRLRGRCTLLSARRLSALTALATAVRSIESGRERFVLCIAADAGGPGAAAIQSAAGSQRAAAAWLLAAEGAGPALSNARFGVSREARSLEPGALPYGMAFVDTLEGRLLSGQAGAVSADDGESAVSLTIEFA